MPHFDVLKIYSCGKYCEKRRNCLLQGIPYFLTIFSTLYGIYFSFQMHFKMSSAICLNLDQSKILSSGSGLRGNQCKTVYVTVLLSSQIEKRVLALIRVIDRIIGLRSLGFSENAGKRRIQRIRISLCYFILNWLVPLKKILSALYIKFRLLI